MAFAGNRSEAAAEWRGAVGRAFLVFGALCLLAVGLLYSQRWLPSPPAPAASPAAAKIGPSFDRRPNVPRESSPGPRVAGAPSPPPVAPSSKPTRPPAAFPADPPGQPAAMVGGSASALAESSPAAGGLTAPASLGVVPAPQVEATPDELPPEAEPPDSADQPAAGPVKRRAEDGASKRSRRSGSARCVTYRTYDSRTQTYRAYDGTTRPCRPEG